MGDTPRTVESIYEDFELRRNGLLQALTNGMAAQEGLVPAVSASRCSGSTLTTFVRCWGRRRRFLQAGRS
jgi:hypothetical protein